MIQLFKNILSYPVAKIILLKTVIKIKETKEPRIFLIDIDNTVANTWPSLLLKWSNEEGRLKSLAIFIKMKYLINILKKSPNNRIIFLTARSYFSRRITYNWLSENGLINNQKNLIITRTAADKIDIIKQLCKECNSKKIYYIDDLAHKYETGKIEFFEKQISEVTRISETNKKFVFFNYKILNHHINAQYCKPR